MTLTFDLLASEVDRSALISGENLCRFALKAVHSVSKYGVHKLVTNGRTDKEVRRGGEHYVPGQNRLAYECSLTVLRSCVFMMLSAFCPR